MHKLRNIFRYLGIICLLGGLALCVCKNAKAEQQPPETGSLNNNCQPDAATPYPANNHDYCDYFDQYGCYLLSFPRSVKLGPSGPSATSGIRFQFDGNNWLTIYPSTASYNPDFADAGDLPEHLDFVEKYAKPDCSVEELAQPGFIAEIGAAAGAPANPGRRIICPDYEYTIVPVSLAQNQDVSYHITIKFQHNSDKFYPIYKEIIDSLVIFKGNEAKAAHNIVRGTGITYKYYQFDPETPWSQPWHYCIDDRIRGKLQAP